MPTVPYNSQPRVGVAPLPGVRLNPHAPIEAFGGGIASQTLDLSGPANVAGGEAYAQAAERARIREEAKREADQVANTHSLGALVLGVNDMLHGPDGIMNRQGKDAFTADQDAYDRFGKMHAEIRAGLSNDVQRAVFDKAAMNEWVQIDSQVQPHIARQRRLYDDEGTKSLIEAKGNEAVAGYADPAIVDGAIAVQKAARADSLRRAGAPDITIKNEVAEVESATRLAVLKRYVDNRQDQAATAYLSKYRAAFVAKDQERADSLVSKSTTEGEAIRQADAITSSAAGESEAFQQAAKIADPLVREKAEQRISLFYNRQAAAKREAQQSAFDHGYQTLRDHGWDLSKVPLSVRNQMGATHEENLVRASEHQQKLARDGGPGDAEQFTTLLNESYFDPETFTSRNLIDVQGLNTKQLNRLQTLQRTVGQRVQREDEKDIVAAMKATEKAGLPPSDPNAKALSGDTSLDVALGIPTPFTPAMLANAVRGGQPYVAYLRHMRVEVPNNITALIAAEKAKAEAKPAKKKAGKS